MGMKAEMKAEGLRKRWLRNTASVVMALGLVFVLAITAGFAAYYYTSMEADLKSRAKSTTEFFANYVDQTYTEFHQSCITYAQTFQHKNDLELQFISNAGTQVVSSYGQWTGPAPDTRDVKEAAENRVTSTFVGKDPVTGERIMAVSSPMIYSNGEVIGVLRYVSSTRIVDMQIIMIALICVSVLIMILVIVLLSSSYYIRSILTPVADIIEKAKRIANGSYGARIQTRYSDEIGDLAETINELSAKISQNEKMQAEFISDRKSVV